MVISHNIPALITHTNLRKNDRLLASSLQRLSTGKRINNSREDASGLAIANKLTFQVQGLNRASENATHGVSMVQTAEGALNEVTNMLQRMRELAVYSANGTQENQDREKIQAEIDELLDEINKISDRTEFNKIKLLSGEASRVTASYNTLDMTKQDKTISTTLYVSDQVPAGTLSYTIDAVGMPAQLVGDVPTLSLGDTVTVTGQFWINGEIIKVEAGETYDTVKEKIIQMCDYAGLTYETDSAGKVVLTTKIAGSNQKIDISGGNTMLAQFGLITGSETGTNATVTVNGMVDESGTLLTTFQNGMSVNTDGNQVTIRGTNGEVIRFNIQVRMDADPSITPPATPPYYGDGKTLAADGTNSTSMELVIKSYGPIMLQIGPDYNNAMSVQIPRLNGESMGLVEFKGGKMYTLLNYQNSYSAQLALDRVDNALSIVLTARSKMGAIQNRLESTISSLDTAAENTESSRSMIQDTDMARESTLYAQRNVMYEAGIAMLAQANQRPMQILSLLQ